MREVIVTGKTVEEATEKACLELGLPREEVSIEILEMPTRKLFKSTPAKVKATADEAEAPAVEEKPAPHPVGGEAEKEAKPAPRLCPYCYGEIDEKATRCPHCTSELPKE